jgi:sensor c-di-GMP phosphodiesterase-like protein
MTIDPEHGDAIVLDAIIALAHRLKAQVVAEGVDQPAQFDYLLGRGVSFMQGYLYAKPMPSREFVAWYAALGQQPVECGDAARRMSGTAIEPG